MPLSPAQNAARDAGDAETPMDAGSDAKQVKAAIAANPAFCDLPRAVIEAVSDAASFRECVDGETIFASGQFDGSVFYLVSAGRLKVARLNAGTGEMQLETLRKGDVFGLAAAVLGPETAAASISMTAAGALTHIVEIEADAFRDVLAQRATLARALMKFFAQRLLAFEEPEAIEMSPGRRVYSELVRLLERDTVSNEWVIAKLPKHRELAEICGVEEAEAAAAIADIIQEGVARRDYPGLVILDMARLNQLTN